MLCVSICNVLSYLYVMFIHMLSLSYPCVNPILCVWHCRRARDADREKERERERCVIMCDVLCVYVREVCSVRCIDRSQLRRPQDVAATQTRKEGVTVTELRRRICTEMR
jgi:hypothetical protein